LADDQGRWVGEAVVTSASTLEAKTIAMEGKSHQIQKKSRLRNPPPSSASEVPNIPRRTVSR